MAFCRMTVNFTYTPNTEAIRNNIYYSWIVIKNIAS